MLWISSDIKHGNIFRDDFRAAHPSDHWLDLSKASPHLMAAECNAIVNHHTSCTVFLGYLEPGWMLDAPSQTVLRKLFRKFPVAMTCYYLESLPFSWKNEIDTLYIHDVLNRHGYTGAFNNGSSLQHEPKVRHNVVTKQPTNRRANNKD